MDPWSCTNQTDFLWSNSTSRSTYQLGLPHGDKSEGPNGFEDNFKPLVSDTLPDSQAYLAGLETKLAKLKSDPNVLQQLAEKREACLRQLLLTNSESDTDISLDTPIEPSPILRTIAPSKQALTEGELVTLIQYDQLVNGEQQSKPNTD
ncbi:hypothetical protein PPYR_12708 [Photinus pyralis]|uniref:Uncharacterized protein n=1 Tax=Photinus pyralis TaxID=7054 RepID=A0A1Y1MYI8_PHOPY|nr:uncharacterized protein LOC116178330 [Photinus pyralis]KAB0793088.1 hypothetical protein PPYR_12708 [Photinus pyralis]